MIMYNIYIHILYAIQTHYPIVPLYSTVFHYIPVYSMMKLYPIIFLSSYQYILLYSIASQCIPLYVIISHCWLYLPKPTLPCKFCWLWFLHIYTYCMYVLMLWTARDWSWLSPTCSWLSPILVCEIHTLPDYSEICWWLNHPSKHTPDIPEYIKLYPKILIDFVH